MREWKINLLSGAALRKEIQEEPSDFSGYISLLEKLKDCWNEIRKRYKNNNSDLEEIKIEIQNFIAEIDEYIEEFSTYDEEDIPIEDDEDSVNMLLRDFYDFCDNYSIWVEI